MSRIEIPPNYQKPRIRWWWPGGYIDPAQITLDLEDLAAKGFGGAEIAFMGLGTGQPTMDVEYLWGGERWNAAVEKAYEVAERLGLHLDLTIGPAFPAMVPGMPPTSPSAAKELCFGRTVLPAGSTSFNAPLPPPEGQAAGISPANIGIDVGLEVVGVHAVKVKNAEGPTWELAGKGGVVDLTEKVGLKGELEWNAEEALAEGVSWGIVVSYMRGSGQTKTVFEGRNDTRYSEPLAHVVDHLSDAGVQAVADYYKDHLLTPELQRRFKAVRGSIFEDSLELAQRQFFTPSFLAAFQALRGYSLTPFLPLIQQNGKAHPFAPILPAFVIAGDKEGEDVRKRVMWDFEMTVSDLYCQKRLPGVKKWANSIGLNFRNQPYDPAIDSALAATKVDIVEGETLVFRGNADSFRMLATGRDVAGINILSDELGAVMGRDYDVTWQWVIELANADFALGVNQVIMHALPYKTSPKSTWPGYMPFLPKPPIPSFAEAWGPRQPQWEFAAPYTAYLARAQSILQKGRAIVDIGIYHSPVEGIRGGWKDPSLNAAGYSYAFPSDGLLALESCKVEGGKLWAEGPGYKALVINDEKALSLAATKKVLEIAKSGLPIIIVGAAPNTIPGLSPTAELQKDEDFVKTAFAEILSLEHCKLVATTADVPAKLLQLGVAPSLTYSDTPNPLITTKRLETDGTKWYFLHNPSSETVKQTVTVLGSGSLTRINLWNGQPESIQVKTDGSENSVFELEVTGKAAAMIRLSPTKVTMESSSSNASTARQQELHDWTLDVESWEPQDASVVGEGSELTKKAKIDRICLQELKPWHDISGLEDVSGIGAYTTAFDVADSGARGTLSLGKVEGPFEVIVNGRQVEGIDCLSPTAIELSEVLLEGKNELVIRVASTLQNRLRVSNPDGYGKRERRSYGLLGPVTMKML